MEEKTYLINFKGIKLTKSFFIKWLLLASIKGIIVVIIYLMSKI